MKAFSIAVLAVLGLLGAASAAQAEAAKPDNDFLKRLYAGEITKQKKSYACFVRQYDAAHLAQHPKQKVSAMKLLVSSEVMEDDNALHNSFRLGLKFRNRPGDFDSSGNCYHPDVSETPGRKEHLGCGVDCDGGGIEMELTAEDKSALIRLDSIRIWRNNKPDDEGFALSGGADDRVFRLDRVSLDMCKSLASDRQELAALRNK